MVTQPLMYKHHRQASGYPQALRDKLVAEGTLAADGPDQMIKEYREHLDKGELLYNPVLAGYKQICGRLDAVPDEEVHRDLRYHGAGEGTEALAQRLTDIAEGFALHSRVKKIIEDRAAMGEGKLPVDWGMAENLAYASLLVSGYGVRISGEDVGRGTFFHRHAVPSTTRTATNWDIGTYHPLKNLQEKQAAFQCFDSVLSEEAVLAFEYGYATANPYELVSGKASSATSPTARRSSSTSSSLR
jgi:2-oxoglutarate dehydrogenase E1 component